MKKITYVISLALCGLLIATSLNAGKLVQVKGSDTMVNLVQILAEQYMEKKPGEAVAVTGGGSGVGIAALINSTVDIADHSRPLKEKEYASCKENGVVPTTIVIGIDGLSVIVNDKNMPRRSPHFPFPYPPCLEGPGHRPRTHRAYYRGNGFLCQREPWPHPGLL